MVTKLRQDLQEEDHTELVVMGLEEVLKEEEWFYDIRQLKICLNLEHQIIYL